MRWWTSMQNWAKRTRAQRVNQQIALNTQMSLRASTTVDSTHLKQQQKKRTHGFCACVGVFFVYDLVVVVALVALLTKCAKHLSAAILIREIFVLKWAVCFFVTVPCHNSLSFDWFIFFFFSNSFWIDGDWVLREGTIVCARNSDTPYLK